MLTLALKGLRFHTLRYVLTALAVVLGVAFLAGTLVLTDTINATFDGLYTQIYRSTDAVVRGQQAFDPGLSFSNTRPPIPAALAERVGAVPGVREVSTNVTGYAQLVGANGKAIGNPAAGPPTVGESWPQAADMNPYGLAAGRPPRTAGEVAIDKHAAEVGHLGVGDTVTVLTTGAPARYRISGVVTWGGAASPLGATLTIFTPAQAARVLARPGVVDTIAVAATPGTSQEQLVARLRSALSTAKVDVISGAAVTAEGQRGVRDALGFFSTFLLVFAGIALFVGIFLVFNTFSIVLAQRERELALLRAVGAGRRQLFGLVLGESALLGVAAAIVGVGAGALLAAGLKALLAGLGVGVPATGLVLSWRTVVVALLVGVGVTLVAALAPARRAAAVPPIAALQAVSTHETTTPHRRAGIGGLVSALGVAGIVTGLFVDSGQRLALVGAGAAVFFLGLTVLGPFVARGATRLLGAPFARQSATGRLAQQNAMRNPHRSAATASALMIGVALVTVMAIIGSSTRASVNAIVDRALRADYVITPGVLAGATTGFSPALTRALQDLPQVEAATGVRMGMARIGGKNLYVLAADPTQVNSLFDVGIVRGTVARMGPDTVAVSTDVAANDHLGIGSPLAVTFTRTGRHVFRVAALYSERTIAGDYVFPLAAAEANFAEQLDAQVYVKLRPGVAPAAGRAALAQVLQAYPTAKLLDQAQFKAQEAATIDQGLALVNALLGLAIIIALIGIANTLALSVHERRREIGLLRAVGMTRGQLRALVRQESVVLALLGALEGIVVGTALGALLVLAMRPQGVTTLAVPIVQLVLTAAGAGLAGVVAALGPARRAARLDVLAAIASE